MLEICDDCFFRVEIDHKEIERLKEENKRLEKALYEACKHANCQFLKIDDEWCEHTEERKYEDDCLKCLRTHFMKEAQDE